MSILLSCSARTPKGLFLTAMGLFLFACGPTEQSSIGSCATTALLGTWKGSILGQSDTMTFAASCSGTASYCSATFDYPNVTASSGNVLVTVTSSNAKSGCLPLGATACAYEVSSSQLSFNCGGSTLTYAKQ